jgi:hypothetical protein
VRPVLGADQLPLVAVVLLDGHRARGLERDAELGTSWRAVYAVTVIPVNKVGRPLIETYDICRAMLILRMSEGSSGAVVQYDRQIEKISQILSKAFEAANMIEDEDLRESGIEYIATVYGSAWNLSQVLEAAQPFEYPEWGSRVLAYVADELSQMETADKAILRKVTHAIRPLDEFWDSAYQPARPENTAPGNKN